MKIFNMTNISSPSFVVVSASAAARPRNNICSHGQALHSL